MSEGLCGEKVVSKSLLWPGWTIGDEIPRTVTEITSIEDASLASLPRAISVAVDIILQVALTYLVRHVAVSSKERNIQDKKTRGTNGVQMPQD